MMLQTAGPCLSYRKLVHTRKAQLATYLGHRGLKLLVVRMYVVQEYCMSRWISSMLILQAGPYSFKLLPAQSWPG